jgi:uncharacterized membrane protein
MAPRTLRSSDRLAGNVRGAPGAGVDRPHNVPTTEDVLLGLGRFFDGIVLHQVLQWHHVLTSRGYPADNFENLLVNALWDGLVHAVTLLVTVVGLWPLWEAARA